MVVNAHLICPVRPPGAIEHARSNDSLFPNPFVYFVLFVVTRIPFCESLHRSIFIDVTRHFPWFSRFRFLSSLHRFVRDSLPP